MQKIRYRFVSNETFGLNQLADWLRSNFTLPINKKCLKHIVKVINHENLHSIIYNFFNIKNEPGLLLKKTGEYILLINGITHAEYESKYEYIYLKFVFVEFVQMILYVIHDVFARKNFFFRIKFYVWKMLGKIESEYEAKKIKQVI